MLPPPPFLPKRNKSTKPVKESPLIGPIPLERQNAITNSKAMNRHLQTEESSPENSNDSTESVETDEIEILGKHLNSQSLA